MKTITGLTSGSQIRVKGILGKITVETLRAFVSDKRYTGGQPLTEQEIADAIKVSEERDLRCHRPTQYAWTMQHAAVLTADYPGKAEAHAADMAARAAAPEVTTGDVLLVDGVTYVAAVMGNYADPVRLTVADPYQMGYKAYGLRQGTLDNAFTAGTPEHEKWYDGWCKADIDEAH